MNHRTSHARSDSFFYWKSDFLLPEWILICSFRPELSINRFLHSVQAYGFSPVWILLWIFRWCERVKYLLHVPHWKDLPSCAVSLCFSRFSAESKWFLQTSHCKLSAVFSIEKYILVRFSIKKVLQDVIGAQRANYYNWRAVEDEWAILKRSLERTTLIFSTCIYIEQSQGRYNLRLESHEIAYGD